MGGHSEAVNVEFEKDFDLAEVKSLLEAAPGIVVVDDPGKQEYPMPKDAHNRDEVFVGRLRRDDTQPNTLNMWIVSDNLRKGAATNAVQIAEYLVEKGLLIYVLADNYQIARLTFNTCLKIQLTMF